ncbi:ABC transporter substrate-binding protein [Rathayibacter sp. Leaf296]|nr:ABC transporter substrate-binding protein [Rathayibacter sp. Leaf296]
MRRRILVTLAIPAVASLALVGCSPSSGGGTAGGGENDHAKLVLGMTQDIQGWDPTAQPSYQGWGADAVYDSLVACDENGEPLPDVAESWELSEDRTSVTATIRSGMTFSDGSPVDSAAVKASFEYASENGGSATRFAGITIDTPDESTVTIAWPTPQPLIVLRLCEARIASPDYLASGDTQVAPVGSGPYTLDAAATTGGSVYSFVKNDDYWDADAYPYKTLELRVLESETASLNALTTGQIQGTLLSATTAEQAEAAKMNLQTLRGNTTRLLITDHLGEKIPALGSVDVRRAMNMVFDKDAMTSQLYRGQGDPAYQIFRPGTTAYIEDLEDPYPFDLEGAKALMEKAGYADGFTLPMPFLEGQNLDILLPYITSQLAEINITVEQQTLSGPTAITSLLSGDYPVPLWQLGNYGESLQDISDYVLTDGNWNVSHQPDATIDGLWNTVLTGTPEEAAQAQQDINRYITEQAWFVPMVYPDGFYATSPDIEVAQSTDYGSLHPLLRDFK